MKLFTCFVVLRIFDITTAIKPKSVNLALETILEFNNRDNSGDVQFINNVQTFLDKIKTIINKNTDGRRSNRDTDQNLTEFLKRAIAILKTYDDEDLEDVFAVIDNEIRKYHYRGCKFYELIQNNDVRRYMAVKLNDVRSKSADEIRHTLKQAFRVLIEDNYDSRVKEFLDYVNSLYRSDAKYKLRSFLNNLENYKSKSKRANLDLIKIVREGVRSILFDHYTDLNQNARRELKLKIETFWKELSSPQYIRHKVWNIKYTRSTGDKYGKFDVRQYEHNPSLNMSLANYSMTSTTTRTRPKWTFPTKIPFNITMPKKLPFNWTLPTWKGSTKTPQVTTKTIKSTTSKKPRKPTKKPKKPKKPKLKRHNLNHYSEENKHVTRYKHDRTRRPHRYGTSGRERLHTLWEEEFEVTGKPKKSIKTLISNHEAEINVEASDTSQHHKKHERNRHSKHKKSHKKYERYHKRYYRRYSTPNFRVSRHSPATSSFRKFAPIHITSEEGMTIESFENAKIPQKMISFRKYNDNDTFGLPNVVTVDINVMRRINDLEREVNDMKSKIKINEPTTTTITNVIEDNYALDFWEGTTANYEYTETETTTHRAPTTSVSTTTNTQNNENVTEVKLYTVPSMARPKNIFIPVNAVQFQNVTRGGVISNKASFNENKTKIEPFSGKVDNGTKKDIKNEIFVMENNFTATPVLEIGTKTIGLQFIPTVENNVTDSKMLVDEKIRKRLEGIFMNLTTPSNLIFPKSLNFSEPPDFNNPFEDIDNMDFP